MAVSSTTEVRLTYEVGDKEVANIGLTFNDSDEKSSGEIGPEDWEVIFKKLQEAGFDLNRIGQGRVKLAVEELSSDKKTGKFAAAFEADATTTWKNSILAIWRPQAANNTGATNTATNNTASPLSINYCKGDDENLPTDDHCRVNNEYDYAVMKWGSSKFPELSTYDFKKFYDGNLDEVTSTEDQIVLRDYGKDFLRAKKGADALKAKVANNASLTNDLSKSIRVFELADQNHDGIIDEAEMESIDDVRVPLNGKPVNILTAVFGKNSNETWDSCRGRIRRLYYDLKVDKEPSSAQRLTLANITFVDDLYIIVGGNSISDSKDGIEEMAPSQQKLHKAMIEDEVDLNLMEVFGAQSREDLEQKMEKFIKEEIEPGNEKLAKKLRVYFQFYLDADTDKDGRVGQKEFKAIQGDKQKRDDGEKYSANDKKIASIQLAVIAKKWPDFIKKQQGTQNGGNQHKPPADDRG